MTHYRNVPGTHYCPNCGHYRTQKHWYRSGKTRCTNSLKWSNAALFQMMGLLEQGQSDAQIARHFGCTPDAVNLARKRHGLPSRRASSLSARHVARLMGVDDKTATKWLAAGHLRGKRGTNCGPHRGWQVKHADLVAFLQDERTWHLWTAERITDPLLRRVAIRAGRPAVRFLTLTEVADRYYVQPKTVHQWIKKGFLPARRWGNHVIDERDLERFALPRIGGWNRKDAA